MALVVVLAASAMVSAPWWRAAGALTMSLLSAAAILAGVARWRPVRRTPWVLAAAGIVLAGVSVAWMVVEPEVGGHPWSDVAIAVAYGVLIAAAAQLSAGKRPGRDLDAVLDGGIVAAAAAIVVWLVVLSPTVASNAPRAHVLESIGLIGGDLVLLVIVGSIASVDAVARNVAYRLILAGLVVSFLSDLVFLMVGIAGHRTPGLDIVVISTLAVFVAVAAAALHPSMAALSIPERAAPRRPHPTRLVLLTVAACLPPVVIVSVQLDATDRWFVGLLALVLAVLIVARLALLVQRGERELAARKALEHRLRHGVTHDPLTHLGNRRWLAARLDRALELAERTDGHVAVLVVDLDDFGAVNDAFGHVTGDQVLVHVAARIVAAVRTSDVVARLGGDEYVICLEAVHDTAEVLEVAGRVEAAVADPLFLEDVDLVVTATVGVATTVDTPRTAEELLRDADAALLRGKEAGRHQIVLCDDELRREAAVRGQIEHELRGAVHRDELVLRYQPEVLLDSGALFGVEALVRWEHPSRGLLGPDQFLPVAERSGLIAEVGSWVIAEACRQRAVWERQLGAAAPVVSINVSPVQLARSHVADELRAGLAAWDLDPSSLRVEVTETAVLADELRMLEALAAIAELGVALAVDDFGTGYFSLRDLARYPIEIIKIDQSFVAGLGGGGVEEAIVRSTIRLAQSLGRATVAEGVETEEQVAVLRRLGCTVAQGYAFGRPMVPDAAELTELAVHGGAVLPAGVPGGCA